MHIRSLPDSGKGKGGKMIIQIAADKNLAKFRIYNQEFVKRIQWGFIAITLWLGDEEEMMESIAKTYYKAEKAKEGL